MSGMVYNFNEKLNTLVVEQDLNTTEDPIGAITALLLHKNNSFDRLCKDTCDKMMNSLPRTYSLRTCRLRQTTDFAYFITLLINFAQGRTFYMLVIAYLIVEIVKKFPAIIDHVMVTRSGWEVAPSGVSMDCMLCTDSRIGLFINLDHETITDWDYRFNNIGNLDILRGIVVGYTSRSFPRS